VEHAGWVVFEDVFLVIGSLRAQKLLREVAQRRAEVEVNADLIEQTVIERTAELAAANQELAAFDYSISHDLRAPLAAVRLRAEMLQRRVRLGRIDAEALTSGLVEIRRQVDRTVDQMRLLLDVARLQAGRLPLERAPVDLVPVVRAAVEEVGATAEHHTLTLQAPAEVVGEWDEWRLHEVLQNLLSNAVKYSPDGGAIETTIEADAASATVRVRDHGVGMRADELPSVFERFYRAPGARRLEGSGLGLYICHTIVDAHGGRIWAESDGLGRGSVFCFALPRSASPE
jgi:signal transduction histidine kinase